MSATLGAFLKLLDAKCRILILERLPSVSLESSAAVNNAGTGHAGMCEMNYTPRKADGSIDVTKAININEQFEVSKQFWAWLVRKGMMDSRFIKSTPHMSFAHRPDDIVFLKDRVEALRQHPLFQEMVYSEDREQLKEWVPLMMKDRPKEDKVAFSYMAGGADVDYGILTRHLIDYLTKQEGVVLQTGWDATDLKRSESGTGWRLKARNLQTGTTETYTGKFAFIGAGGRALTLLQKTGIPEAKGYGGFPVSGMWLMCHNEEVIQQHHVKVYGKAAKGAPPMSVPHLDARHIDGKNHLLFGPFAGFSTKFLKQGSLWDLPKSLKGSNLLPMMQVGLDNFSLVKYLVGQVTLKPEKRLEMLRVFYPNAKMEDWNLAEAGQRVQIIKKNDKGHGVLAFGTEVVHSKDGTVAALLGASPGASTSVHIILKVLKACFGHLLEDQGVINQLKEMIPSYGRSLVKDGALGLQLREKSHEALGLAL